MIKFLAVFILIFSFTSCTESNSDGSAKQKREARTLAKSQGSHAEMLALMKDELFEGATGKALLKVFATEQDGLPRPEPLFKVIRVEPARANRLLKRNKSILLVQKSDSTAITIVKDVWARPQIFATITAPTDEEISQLILEHSGELISRFQEHDRMIMRRVQRKTAMKKLPDALTKLGIEKMIFSSGFKQTLDRQNLKIFKNKGLRTDQYMIFYVEPMRDGILSGEDIIYSRDSIGKNYFEGFRDSSYMATEMIVPPVQKIVEVGGLFAVETRGLWKTVGDFMGGPFLSYTIYDEVNDQIIVVEGMVYGPDSKKRNVLFELETMMRSVRMTAD